MAVLALGAIAERWELPAWGWILLMGVGMELALLMSGGSFLWHILVIVCISIVIVVFVVPMFYGPWVREPWMKRVYESFARLKILPMSSISWQENALLGIREEQEDAPSDSHNMDDVMKDCAALCQLWMTQKKKGQADPLAAAQLRAFIVKKGFNRLELSEDYEGRNLSPSAMTNILTKLACFDRELASLIASLNGGVAASIEKYGTSYQKKKYLEPLMTDESFIYRYQQTEARIYGVVCRGKYRGRTQLGVRLHQCSDTIPAIATLAGMRVSCYDPQGLLGENAPLDLCVLVPRDLFKKDKQQFKIGNNFIPMSLILDKGVSVLKENAVSSTLAYGIAYILRLTHKLSAVIAARQWIGLSANMTSLAALGYELSALRSLADARDSPLGEEGEGRWINALVRSGINRANVLGLRELGQWNQMNWQLERSGEDLLPICISRHSYWRVVLDEYMSDSKEEGVSHLFAHYIRAFLRCFGLGLSWGWIARDPRTQLERRLAHITAAFGMVMNILIMDTLFFMRPFPRCDRAWQSFYLLLTMARCQHPPAEEGWKTALHLCQYEINRLLMNRQGNPFLKALVNWIVFPWGRNYDRPTAAEERDLAERLIIPSQYRQDLFISMNMEDEDVAVDEEMIKLAWLVKDIYGDLRDKGLQRPWSSSELDWYKELCAERRIKPQDLKIMTKFYQQAQLLLRAEEL